MRKLALLSLVACSMTLLACGAAPDGSSESAPGVSDEHAQPGPGGKGDAWNADNDPNRLSNGDFVYNLSQLPQSGEMDHLPIPGDYWPTAYDSINRQWMDGNDSPTVKYAKAFGIDPNKLSRKLSGWTGLGSSNVANGPSCTPGQNECGSGSRCAPLPGSSEAKCVPTWWGICDGWSPYALQEALPTHAVSYNGVTFYPGDLNALMSVVYTQVHSRSVAARCNASDAHGQVFYDENGRVIDSKCRDVNPGSLYVVASNLLGRQHRGFVVDRTWDAEVWNQPVRGYRVTKLQEISSGTAQSLVQENRGQYTPMKGVIIQDAYYSPSYQYHTGTFTTNGGHITLVFRGTGRINFLAFEGSRFDQARESYRCAANTGEVDSLTCSLDTEPGQPVHWKMKVSSNARVTIGWAGESAGRYEFNDRAERFFDVTMELDWVEEAQPQGEIWDAKQWVDSHTKTSRYTFVLEADRDGNVIGGEYTGASKRFHADTIWMPIGHPDDVKFDWRTKISYDKLKMLNDAAAK